MCYGMNCMYERSDGSCGMKWNQVCPVEFDEINDQEQTVKKEIDTDAVTSGPIVERVKTYNLRVQEY